MHAVAAAAHPFRSDMMRANSPHNSVSQGDLELLDVLIPCHPLPHQPNFAAGSKSKPLSTLNALRRPPIDPMVLAAV